MSYDKTTWASGDVVTSAKLNKIEDGIAASDPLIVNGTQESPDDPMALDKTFAEIKAAVDAGIRVVIKTEVSQDVYGTIYTTRSYAVVLGYQTSENWYVVIGFGTNGPNDMVNLSFSCESEDGYPASN